MKLTELPADKCVKIENLEQLNSVSNLLASPLTYEWLPYFNNYIKRNDKVTKGSGLYVSSQPWASVKEETQILKFEEIEL
jgi:hypothetical protein